MDDWPKPELLYALTPFEVVAGLRTPADAADLLRALAVDQLEPLAGRAFGRDAASTAMAGALASVLEWPEPGRAGLVAAVVRRRARGWRLRRFCGRSATRTRAPRRCGSPPITRVTSGWSRCC